MANLPITTTPAQDAVLTWAVTQANQRSGGNATAGEYLQELVNETLAKLQLFYDQARIEALPAPSTWTAAQVSALQSAFPGAVLP